MKDNLIEQLEYRGHTIDVCYDDSVMGPNEWDNQEVFLVYDHRDFCIKVKGFDPKDIFHVFQTKNLYDSYHIFPVNSYIHSGVSLSLRRSYPFNDRWDSSFAGFALVKRTKGWSWRREKAYSIAESLIEEWNMYLSGDVYGYNWEHGGCWGFYGKSGKEEMIKEAKLEIDYHIKKKNKEALNTHLSSLKIWLKNKVPLTYRKPLILETI